MMQRITYLCLFTLMTAVHPLASADVAGSDERVERYVRAENVILVPQELAVGRDVEARIGEFAIVQKAEDDSPVQGLAAGQESQGGLVIRDQFVGDYGLSDGTFFVFFHDRDSLEETVREHGLRVEDLFANAKMARVSIEDGQDVFAVMRQVQQDPRVRGVELNTTFDRLKPQ